MSVTRATKEVHLPIACTYQRDIIMKNGWLRSLLTIKVIQELLDTLKLALSDKMKACLMMKAGFSEEETSAKFDYII